MNKYALLSVSDKTNIVDFAKELEELDFQIISTGGTFKALHENGIKNIIEVSDFTGFPEGLGGRVKTLTPEVFGGILNIRDDVAHQKFVTDNKIQNIDIVCVNLYPFKSVYEDPNKTFVDKVENIDIGGPSMIRAAAKNWKFCAPVVDPSDYGTLIDELQAEGNISTNTRKKLATKVFEMTAHYDLLIAKFWAEQTKITEEDGSLRYGENPHQQAVSLLDPFASGVNLLRAEILNGKPLSYNNLGDASGALELALGFAGKDDAAFATIIKHATPCGAAFGKTIADAFERAYTADKMSAFGGVITLNKTCDIDTAKQITSFFNEIIIAPDYDKDALAILKKKKNLRVLKISDFHQGQTQDIVLKKIRGGILVQDRDIVMPDFNNLDIPTQKKPTKEEMKDLILAWKIVKIVKSNAIVVVKNGVLLSKGGGQTSRVESMEIALRHAGDNAKGAVVASDAFFPFPDAMELASKYGITSIIQPGGSKNDTAVFDTCDRLNMSTVLTGLRGFLH